MKRVQLDECGPYGGPSGKGWSPRPTKNKIRLMLDSGAYSAWSRSTEINLKEYIQYCHDHRDLVETIVGLDVIPGRFGAQKHSQQEVEISAKRSYANQQTMKAAGLNPIPVFHQGERIHWLEQMLRDGETYIGLSPSKFNRVDDKMRWLDMVFNIISDKEGRPLVKTHGFAATSFRLMTSYPWRSVDSTTWILTPSYGQIIVPALIDGKFDYTHATRISVTGIQPQNKSAAVKQYEGLGDRMREAIEKYISEVVGSDMVEQRNLKIARCRAMLVYYINLNKQLYDVRHKRSGGLSGPDHFDAAGTLKPMKPWQMIQYYVSDVAQKEWTTMMCEVEANDRLLSYWLLKEKPRPVLEQFVKEGTLPYTKSKIKPDWSNEAYRSRRVMALYRRIKRNGVESETDRAT